MTQKPIKSESLSLQIVRILVDRIKNGIYESGSQLPTENELAEEFEVSRSTIRHSMGILNERRLIFRQQGIGTFVSRIPRISNPLNTAVDFNYWIEGFGRRPSVEFLDAKVFKPSKRIEEKLMLQAGDMVFSTKKIFTADGDPLIYVENSIPLWPFSEEIIKEITQNPKITEPLVDFIENNSNQRIDYHLAHVCAEIAVNFQYPGMPFAANTPILKIEEVAISTEEKPLWHSFEYFSCGIISFDIIRKRD